jgi:signal transduction histidine kinase
MFKEKNLSKFIIAVPILFIVLTATIITLIHINQADKKFKNDSKRLVETFLRDEKKQLTNVLDSVNSYITYKKLTALNILKNKVREKTEFANSVLSKLYNNSIGIESLDTIQINILASISQLNSEAKGKYFLYGYTKEQIPLSEKNFSERSNTDKDFYTQIDYLLKQKNEGYIFYKESILKDKKLRQLNKISYLKKFESLSLVLGYSEYIEDFEINTKREVLKRLNLMKLQNKSSIITLDNQLNIIQNSSSNLKNIPFSIIESDESIVSKLFDYSKMSKIDLIESEYKYFWKKINEDNYKLLAFNYVDDWDWLVGINVNINDINKHVEEIIGINKSKKNEIIEDSIKTAFIFIFIASLFAYFISLKINRIFNEYKMNIENQKSALKNINATLEIKVDDKTKELEILNLKLKDKFNNEVQKNRHKDELLLAQSKMASMGEMIGNIAHQWRQPLSTISTIASGNCVKIDFDLINKDGIKNDFIRIVDCTKHLSNTIEDFRNFFIDNKSIEKFDLIELVDKNLILLGSSLQNNYINIIKNFTSVEISGVKNELIQATINIINNAKDILLDKEEEKRHIVIDIYKDKTHGYLVIKDSGGGIPDNIKERIYEPYFSTKDKSKGTGIGLHMTKEIIVNNMNAQIFVSNEEFILDDITYFGACFKIAFPLDFS